MTITVTIHNWDWLWLVLFVVLASFFGSFGSSFADSIWRERRNRKDAR